MKRNYYWLLSTLCLLAPTPGLAQEAVHQDGFAEETGHELAPAKLAAAPAFRRAPYEGSRLSLVEGFISLTAARGEKAFNGAVARNTTVYGVELGGHFSLIELFFFDSSKNRFRLADYLRTDLGLGWMTREFSEIAPGLETKQPGGTAWANVRLAGGVQASYLVSDDLELGAVIGKINSSKSIFEISDGGGANRWQNLRSARVRYGHLAGEFQSAVSPVSEHSRSAGFATLVYDRQDFHRALRLRYYASPGKVFGIDLDRENRRFTKDGKTVYVTNDDSDHTSNTLRLLIGFSH